MRPGGSSWGLTGDLVDALPALRGRASGNRATSFVPRATARVSKGFSSLFDEGFEAPGRLGGLEILLLDAAAALVMAHSPVDGRETIPVGVLIKDRVAANGWRRPSPPKRLIGRAVRSRPMPSIRKQRADGSAEPSDVASGFASPARSRSAFDAIPRARLMRIMAPDLP